MNDSFENEQNQLKKTNETGLNDDRNMLTIPLERIINPLQRKQNEKI